MELMAVSLRTSPAPIPIPPHPTLAVWTPALRSAVELQAAMPETGPRDRKLTKVLGQHEALRS